MTGGLAYQNGNDLNSGLARVLEDQRGYYLLAYSPDTQMFKAKNNEELFHRIKVAVKGKGSHVRSRSGFFGIVDRVPEPIKASPAQELERAILSPFRSLEIRLQISPVYLNASANGSTVFNLLYIDARDLAFAALPDGQSEAELTILAIAYGADNKPLGAVNHEFKYTVPTDHLAALLQGGALLTLQVQVPTAGRYQIRTAVRDNATSKIGTANKFIEIPDEKKEKLSLVSIILGTDGTLTSDKSFLGLTAAKRQFSAGGVLEYFCLTNSGKAKINAGQGNIQAQVRIFRGEEQIFSGPAAVKTSDDGRQVVIGRLRLTPILKPGEYILQIVASGPDSRRPADKATQWIDFEVVP
jgi:hypothetical protein